MKLDVFHNKQGTCVAALILAVMCTARGGRTQNQVPIVLYFVPSAFLLRCVFLFVTEANMVVGVGSGLLRGASGRDALHYWAIVLLLLVLLLSFFCQRFSE